MTGNCTRFVQALDKLKESGQVRFVDTGPNDERLMMVTIPQEPMTAPEEMATPAKPPKLTIPFGTFASFEVDMTKYDRPMMTLSMPSDLPASQEWEPEMKASEAEEILESITEQPPQGPDRPNKEALKGKFYCR